VPGIFNPLKSDKCDTIKKASQSADHPEFSESIKKGTIKEVSERPRQGELSQKIERNRFHSKEVGLLANVSILHVKKS
jgi:hypothetical protein